MTKLLQTVGLVVVGLVIIAVASPAFTNLVHAFIPLIVTAGVVIVILRVTWFLTR
jgi:hypothetical protein